MNEADLAGGEDAPGEAASDASFSYSHADLERIAVDGVNQLNVYIHSVDRRHGGTPISAKRVKISKLAGRDIRTSPATAGGSSVAVAAVAVSAMTAEELARLREVTVAVVGQDAARRILEEERFVILSGTPGCGKRAGGISLFGSANLVLDVDPSVQTEALLDFGSSIKRDDARHYVIESIIPATACALTDFAARKLTTQLRDADAYLVITVDSRVPLDPDVHYRTVAWNDRPEPIEALRRHLRYYLSDDVAAELVPQLATAEILPHLAQRELRLTDRLARAVATAYRDGGSIDEAIAGLGLNARQDITDWFAEKKTSAEIAFLLACAVLGGCSYSTVSKHADEIELILTELSGGIPQAPELTRSRSKRLEAGKAKVGIGWVNTEFGPTVTDTVALESVPLVEAVLDVVWREFDLVRQALLRWLCRAGGDRDAGVRIRAAFAAGQLAEYDFGAIRNELLLPWAKSESDRTRGSAAFALGVPAGETTAGQVLGLLRHWATLSSPGLIWTTTAAYGSYVGLAFPDVAMGELLSLLLRGRGHEADIRASVRRLILLDTQHETAVTPAVLAGLADWLAEPAPAPQTAASIFLDLLDTAGRALNRESRAVWDRFANKQTQPYAATLLARCMRQEELHQQTFTALRQLLVIADGDDDVDRGLQGLVIAALAEKGDPLSIRRLTRYLNQWSARSLRPRSVDRLLAKVAEETHT